MTSDFSAEASIYNLTLTFLQPFELAEVTENHTHATYTNAIEQGSLDYLTKYKTNCIDNISARDVAASANQLEALKLLINLDTIYTTYNTACCTAAWRNSLKILQMIIPFATNFDEIFWMATSCGRLEIISFLNSYGSNNKTVEAN